MECNIYLMASRHGKSNEFVLVGFLYVHVYTFNSFGLDCIIFFVRADHICFNAPDHDVVLVVSQAHNWKSTDRVPMNRLLIYVCVIKSWVRPFKN